ncbi:hypothetical protein IL252_09645 [Halomicrobium sp. IBSBa]|uniref:hypothetical protein n=1 Tax=unclassified Halomicrobium TaxID=2610901 RepID=UPI001ABF25E9|nr:hypothetical protein [Halomicrobium sp. IBSBa]MBO4248077.1 hypothetical protein [Halomicrobium sp. IBSBa]
MTERTYRCSNCREHTVTRDFDVSHLSVTCPNCEEFSRFVNGRVIEQFESLESSPPDHLDWEALDRTEKLLISERIVRQGHSIEDFEMDGE